MKHALIACLTAGLVALLSVSLIAAQSGYALDDTFDSSVSSWTPTLHLKDGQYVAYATVTWLANKDLATTFPSSLTQAFGVMQTERSATGGTNLYDVQKNVYLQPGHYEVQLRAGSDLRTIFEVAFQSGVTNPTILQGYLDNQFTEETSSVFTVVSPGPVTIILRGDNAIFVDWVRVVPYTGLTPTPYTTLAVTPIPTEYQATPMPAPTQFCQNQAATPGPVNFDVTPTATPDTSGDWQFTDNFSEGSLSADWEISNSGAVVNPDISGPDNMAGVLEFRYAPPDSVPQLVYHHPITPNISVDGWAMANALPIGVTATVHVMLWDGPTYGWVEAGSQEFGIGQWYPFHIVVTDPGLHSTPSSAVALYLSGPAGDKAYLDNLDIYNSERGIPFCGAFTPTTPTGGGGTYIVYPADKPCPAPNSGIQDVPNNFWGPLFFWMSIQFLNITAPFPLHIFQGYALAIQEFGNAPFWRYVQVVTMMFDLRPVLAMALLLMVLEGVRLIYSAWRLILKIIPMFG